MRVPIFRRAGRKQGEPEQHMLFFGNVGRLADSTGFTPEMVGSLGKPVATSNRINGLQAELRKYVKRDLAASLILKDRIGGGLHN